MTPRLALALLRRGGVSLLGLVAVGWWAFHLDAVTRAERAQAEERFRLERLEDRKQWLQTLKEVSEACGLKHTVNARMRAED